jgi:hypothetical protein
VKFETYHGALVIVRSTFDWSLWITLVFDGLAHPHSWIPYVQIGFNMHLYINVLFSRESLDFRPMSHDMCRTFKLRISNCRCAKECSCRMKKSDMKDKGTAKRDLSLLIANEVMARYRTFQSSALQKISGPYNKRCYSLSRVQKCFRPPCCCRV